MTRPLPGPARRVLVAPVAAGFVVAGSEVAFLAGEGWLDTVAAVVVGLGPATSSPR